VTGLFQNYIALVNLAQENERLRLQVQAQQEELNHYVNSSVQFNLLRDQLGFLEGNPERKVFAEVTGESVDNFHHVLLINKGRQAGIRRNYPVVLREGVVGRVQSVTATQSVVQLILDRRHSFPVLIQRSRERMVVQGEGGNLRLLPQDRGIVAGTGDGLRMQRIRMLADVEVGDRVITSGMAGIFPKGLLVGTVASVGRERHELFQSAEIKPVVDFNKIEGVFVVLRDAAEPDHPLFTQP
jgi:rod shape-determining protein MreC